MGISKSLLSLLITRYTKSYVYSTIIVSMVVSGCRRTDQSSRI